VSELRPEDRADEIARTLGIGESLAARFGARLWTFGAIGAVLVVALLALALSGDGDGVTYKTENTRRGDMTVIVTATGTLQPTNQVDVGSELSGTIRTVSVDFNDVVTVGQELAKLDTSKLDSSVLQSRAGLESAKAKVAQSQASLAEAESQIARLERVRELSGGKVPSQADIDTASAEVLRARADVASSKAAVTQAQATLDGQLTDLSKASIRSPINGIVLVRAVEPGATVAASLQAPVLFTLAEDLTRMELLVSVDEADVGQVTEGQSAAFTVDAWPERRFDAKVQQVRFGAQTLDGVVTYQTVLEVDNGERVLRPGMTATAEITVKQLTNALLVPNSALRFVPPARAEKPQGGILSALLPRRFGPPPRKDQASAKQAKVWVLKKGVPEAVELTTGSSDGTWTEVRAGDIAPDTPLVTESVAVKK